jgi:alpha-maltose-1-phosphate synthase
LTFISCYTELHGEVTEKSRRATEIKSPTMKTHSIILSHSGKQHSYHVAKALNDLSLLEKFYTSSYIKSRFLQKRLVASGNTFWSRRFVEGLGGDKVSANWRFEIPEILWRFKEGKSQRVQKAVYERDVNFDNFVARALTRQKKANLYWGFQGSCHASLKAARVAGMQTWCELSTAHITAAKRILTEETILQPQWAATIDNLTFPADYEQRLVEEPHLADRSIAASQFTKSTLLEVGIAEEQITVLPLGFESDHIPYRHREEEDITSRPLRLLYAGTVTQRKGISYLLEAMKMMQNDVQNKEVELHIIGGIQNNHQTPSEYNGLYHYHPPVSQLELFHLYGDFDALVLPTIFEGFGLVIVEAMAAGLPVITTPHSIGPELITSGENGYIIPVRDSQAIADAVHAMRQLTNEQFINMSLSAREAALNYSWEAYALRLKTLFES